MSTTLLTVKLQSDHSLVTLRDRCRHVGELFGLETLHSTRLITAVSEIGRNALQYAGGAVVTFDFVPAATREQTQSVVVKVQDSGKGLPVTAWSKGNPVAQSGGISGSKRLVDEFSIDTSTSGTAVLLGMTIPRGMPVLTSSDIAARVDELVRRRPQSPREELELQNRETLFALEELRQRQAELVQADERKDEFLAMLAHELRNPLSAITMTVALWEQKKLATAADIERYRNVIGRQAQQLTRLITDLMDVSRISRGLVDLKLQPIGLATLVRQSIEMIQSAIEAKAHAVDIEMPPEDLWVNADGVRFKQILSNLIHNAARYTPRGGRILVEVEQVGASAQISISDNGMGIAPAMLPKIFDLFAQADRSLVREDAGLGVGLTVVQRLVRDHGGTIYAESEGLGRGARFVLRLPLVSAPSTPISDEIAVTDVDATGRPLLIIDDNADSAVSLALALELSGHQCKIAYDGQEGLSEALRTCPHAVVADIGLPTLDGFAIARALRERYGDDLILVAMSGYASQSVRERAAGSGFDHFLVKPVDIKSLQVILQGLPT